MSKRRVLSVGQCAADHARISSVLAEHFHAEVIPAETIEEANGLAASEDFDLVLVNRLFDSGGESGLDYVGAYLADPSRTKVPVMLVSNYDDSQEEAVSLGAAPGFGKSSLGQPAMLDKVKPYLG
jgi:response regulator RpfG family c-di-GMP phosphodiesterase